MTMTSLVDLPDDIILEVITHLETARDLAHLARTCRRLHLLGVSGGGWRAFVRARFPLLSVGGDGDGETRWDAAAETLAGAAAAWDRRSFRPVALLASDRADNFFTGCPTFAHPFSPAVDAALTFGGDYEVVAWGAGEAVLGRFRPTGHRGRDGAGDAWFRFEGERAGFRPVTGDVTAVKLAEPAGRLGMLVGRASGHLQLVSAASGDAGSVVEQYALPPPPEGSRAASWGSVGYVDVLAGQETLVAGNRSTVCAFPMRSTDQDASSSVPVPPLGTHSFLDPSGRPRFIHAARSLGGGDAIACALGWDDRPLRWLTVTPSGFVAREMPRHPFLDAQPAGGLSRSSTTTTIRALECVGPGFPPSRAGADMLLTSWDDGTVRLFDPRAGPSLSDAVYRDAFQPHETASSLLSWGTHRFAAGSNNMALVKLFDYRWPRGVVETHYHASDAAPCSRRVPVPPPQGEPVDRATALALGRLGACCDHARGTRCVFHAASRTPAYRPNACLLLQPFAVPKRSRSTAAPAPARPSRVHCMAKSSDAAGSFYVGLAGAVAEVRIGGDGGGDGVTAREEAAAAKRGARVRETAYCFLETGGGRVDLTDGQAGSGVSSYMPSLVSMRPEQEDVPEMDGARAARHRWDERFWRAEHFHRGS